MLKIYFTFKDKFKENNRIWNLLQSALINLLNGEKSYNNLFFLNLKSISKQDKSYEPTIVQLEQIVKECTVARESASQQQQQQMFAIQALNFFDLDSLINLCTQLIQFVEYRFHMMTFYVEFRDREKTVNPNDHIESVYKQLVEIEENFCRKAYQQNYLMNYLRNLCRFQVANIKYWFV